MQSKRNVKGIGRMRIAVIMGKMDSGGKKNLVMEYYRHIDREKIQFDFICDADSQAIPDEEIEELGGKVYRITPYQNIFRNMYDIFCFFTHAKYDVIVLCSIVFTSKSA